MYILWKYSFHWVNGPINVILRTALRGSHVPTPFGPIYITLGVERERGDRFESGSREEDNNCPEQGTASGRKPIGRETTVSTQKLPPSDLLLNNHSYLHTATSSSFPPVPQSSIFVLLQKISAAEFLQEQADYIVSMLLSPAMLPHLNTAFRNGSSGTLDTESVQSSTTSGNVQKRNQYGLVNDLSGSALSAVTGPSDIRNAAEVDNNGKMDQTDLIEAITFASLYGFQAVPIRIKILLHRALSTLTRKRAEAIIRRTGWKIDDFERGFIQEIMYFLPGFWIVFWIAW
uniref:Bm10017 n=1 Tax=Brugia malayi TaxID=6279 RepID=A0A0J9XW59_BRUMA|nr:Bm10017 [Brugia malayi]